MRALRVITIGMVLASACAIATRYATAGDLAAPAAAPVARKDLLTAVLAPGTLVSRVEIKEVTLAPNVKAPLHLHPCPVTGTVTAGTIAFQIEGKPVRHLNAGDAFYEPAQVRIARFDNDGAVPAKFTAVYLIGDGSQELVRILAQ